MPINKTIHLSGYLCQRIDYSHICISRGSKEFHLLRAWHCVCFQVNLLNRTCRKSQILSLKNVCITDAVVLLYRKKNYQSIIQNQCIIINHHLPKSNIINLTTIKLYISSTSCSWTWVSLLLISTDFPHCFSHKDYLFST